MATLQRRSSPDQVFEPLDRRDAPAARAVHQRLRSAILSLALPPGSSLPELEIARQLGVSRTPVREAIARLVEDGLVVVYPQVGSFVRRIVLDDVAEAQFIREALETAAAQRAAESERQDGVVAMRRLIEEQREAASTGDVNRFFGADVGMHNVVFALAGHPGVWERLRSVGFQMDRLRRLSLPGPHTLQELVSEHEQLVQAIEVGDGDAATAIVRAHTRRVLTYAPQLARSHPDFFEPSSAGVGRTALR